MSYLFDKVVAASAGGACVVFAMTPLDVVKARLQAGRRNKRVFTGTLDAFTSIARHEGVLALWRGVWPSLWMTVPSSALYFTTYEYLREWASVRHGPDSANTPMIAGVLARTLTVTATSPFELVRTSLQAGESDRPQSLMRIFMDVFEKGGVRALWGGLPPTLIRDVPFSAIYWTLYEKVKKGLVKHELVNVDSTFLLNFASGASAGTIAALTTNPVDVVKTRRQMNLDPIHNQGKLSMKGIVKQIIQEEGVRGFWNGVMPRAAKTAPACAIMIASYELCKKWLRET